MNLIERTAFFTERVTEIIKISHLKGLAYAGEEDALSNFKEQAKKLGLTPFQIWNVFFDKHVRGIESAISRNPSAPSDLTEHIQGRITDAIIYLLILSALLQDLCKEEWKVEQGFDICLPKHSS
jgi:hypothetical protein